MKKIISILVLFAILTTLVPTAIPAYAASTTYTATKVYALALSCPYHFTISVQNNDLVISGTAPSYVAGASLKVSLIKPVNYASCTVGSDGRAIIAKDPAINLKDSHTVEQLKPTVVKTLTHTLTCTNGIAPLITVTDSYGDTVLTSDLPNVPKLDLAGIPDGVYNLRVGLSIDPAYANLYCDNIIIVVDGGEANLQVLPNYRRYITYAGACTIYRGYSLDKWDVRPAITSEDFDRWLLSPSGLTYSID